MFTSDISTNKFQANHQENASFSDIMDFFLYVWTNCISELNACKVNKRKEKQI